MQVAGFDKAKPSKVLRTKVNLRGEDWWISATRTRATQMMTLHLWGTHKRMTLYMCLRLISLCFLERIWTGQKGDTSLEHV